MTRLEIMQIRSMADGAPPEVELANGQVISLKESICLPPCWAVRIIHVCDVAINALAEAERLRQALRDYGEHEPRCRYLVRCVCGLEEEGGRPPDPYDNQPVAEKALEAE